MTVHRRSLARSLNAFALVLALVPTFAGPATASALAQESTNLVEFRFSGTHVQRWHTTRESLTDAKPSPDAWLPLQSSSTRHRAWSGSRVVLGLRPGRPLPTAILRRLGLRPDRQPDPNTWILQARDPGAAAEAAQQLALHPDVAHAAPVLRRPVALQAPFAPRPNDPYFTRQWHLENRDESATRLGPDVNPRGAWAFTRGAGVNIGISDIGFEVEHPDLINAARGQPHFDFVRNQSGTNVYGAHATSVAGLAAATGDNHVGVDGVAPTARLTSLIVFDNSGTQVSEERMMDMYQYRNDEIQVLNLSWGNDASSVLPISALESIGVSNAITSGRGGRGVILVHAGGNGRFNSAVGVDGNANNDAAGNDPRFIDVAAVRIDGRAASYSNPGACLLVGAPSGDQDDPFARTETLFTTDRVGSSGYNVFDAGDLANYAYGSTGFDGTSASTPLVSGIAALLLSANPNLGYRDVQQILVHASRYYDDTDPMVHTNSAGFRVGDNQGYGVPDSGEAVRLARAWSNRPPLVSASFPTNVLLDIPDDGLRVVIATNATDAAPLQLRCQPGRGPHPDEPTSLLPLTFVGRANSDLTNDLHGQAALIERGGGFFRDKVVRAAQAGAPFAVIYNDVGGNQLIIPEGTDYVPIPVVLIGETDGRALVTRLQAGEPLQARLQLTKVQQAFTVTNTLLCEHVGLRVRTDHSRRGDVRITLRSPSGTRSVLERLGNDTDPGPDNWTFWSVQHFYESSAGTWTAEFADENPQAHGFVRELELILRGVPIVDADADGLDDRWEQRWFGSLDPRPSEDPDGDGLSNAREQILGSDPTRSDRPLSLEIAAYDARGRWRLSWPGQDGTEYRLMQAATPGTNANPTELARIPGRFPETDFVLPLPTTTNQFFWLRAIRP